MMPPTQDARAKAEDGSDSTPSHSRRPSGTWDPEPGACHLEPPESLDHYRDRPGKLLVAGETSPETDSLLAALSADGHQTLLMGDAASAMEALGREPALELVLADLRLPENGAERLMDYLNSQRVSQPLPLIILSDDQGMDWVVKSLSGGAVDFVRKPFAPAEALARVKKALIQSRTMRFFYQAAHRDHLTGLYNSRIFEDMLSHEAARARRESQPLGLLFADLDRFKLINDVHGHLVGDQVLKEFARRVCEQVRESDLVARYGGEEFIVLAPATGLQGAQVLAERIRASMEEPVETGNGLVAVTVSLGVAAMDPAVPETGEELLERADIALYLAKEAGRNLVRSSL